eukprot:403348228
MEALLVITRVAVNLCQMLFQVMCKIPHLEVETTLYKELRKFCNWVGHKLQYDKTLFQQQSCTNLRLPEQSFQIYLTDANRTFNMRQIKTDGIKGLNIAPRIQCQNGQKKIDPQTLQNQQVINHQAIQSKTHTFKYPNNNNSSKSQNRVRMQNLNKKGSIVRNTNLMQIFKNVNKRINNKMENVNFQNLKHLSANVNQLQSQKPKNDDTQMTEDSQLKMLSKNINQRPQFESIENVYQNIKASVFINPEQQKILKPILTSGGLPNKLRLTNYETWQGVSTNNYPVFSNNQSTRNSKPFLCSYNAQTLNENQQGKTLTINDQEHDPESQQPKKDEMNNSFILKVQKILDQKSRNPLISQPTTQRQYKNQSQAQRPQTACVGSVKKIQQKETPYQHKKSLQNQLQKRNNYNSRDEQVICKSENRAVVGQDKMKHMNRAVKQLLQINKMPILPISITQIQSAKNQTPLRQQDMSDLSQQGFIRRVVQQKLASNNLQYQQEVDVYETNPNINRNQLNLINPLIKSYQTLSDNSIQNKVIRLQSGVRDKRNINNQNVVINNDLKGL